MVIEENDYEESKKVYNVEKKLNSDMSMNEKLQLILNTHKNEKKRKEKLIKNLVNKEKDKLKNDAILKIDKNKKERREMKIESKIKVKKKEIETYKYIKGKRREEMLNHWSYGLVRCNNEACKGYAKLRNRDINACDGIGKVGYNNILNLKIGKYTREKKDLISKLYEEDKSSKLYVCA